MNNSISVYAYIFRLGVRINLTLEEAGKMLDNAATAMNGRYVEHVVVKVGTMQHHRWIPKVSE